MPVIYNDKKIIPAPFIDIQRRTERFEGGGRKRGFFAITATGTISAEKGSPDEDGVLWDQSGYPADTATLTDDNRLAIFREKFAALQTLFEDDGKWFEIQPYDGTAPIKFKPRIMDISLNKGNTVSWYHKCEYVITMEADTIFFGETEIDGALSAVEESWAIEATDDKQRAFKLTHQLSSARKDLYDDDGDIESYGWELAKTDVEAAMGVGTFISGEKSIRDLTSLTPYNHVYTENIDVKGGKYSVTETWFLYDGGVYFEDYEVSTRYDKSSGNTTVAINGTVTGLATTEGFGDRWTNAQTGWTTISGLLLSRAQTISGHTLNAMPNSTSVGKNPLTGVITYGYEYNNQSCATVTDALWERVTVQDSYATPIIARHICIARAIGPVLQEIGTQTEKKRTLSIEVQMAQATGCPPVYASEPDVTDIISYYTPSGGVTQGPYLEQNNQSWSRETGKYSRNLSWFWI